MSAVDIIPFIIICCAAVSSWLLAKKVLLPVYILAIIINSCNFIYNTFLFLALDVHKTIIAYNVLAIWGICMAIKGIINFKHTEIK